MRHLIILTILIAIMVYHIKNTNYSLTVYLVQILLAILFYNLYQKFKKRRKEKEL